jgi:hypothetical protein
VNNDGDSACPSQEQPLNTAGAGTDFFEEFNAFRGALLTKVVIDRKQKITTAPDGTAELRGPPWPEVALYLNHINHAHYRNGLGPQLFLLTFTMVHKLTGSAELFGDSLGVSSILHEGPAMTITMQSGNQIAFACGSATMKFRTR